MPLGTTTGCPGEMLQGNWEGGLLRADIYVVRH